MKRAEAQQAEAKAALEKYNAQLAALARLLTDLCSFCTCVSAISPTFIAPAARELDPVKGAAVGGLLLSVVGAAATCAGI